MQIKMKGCMPKVNNSNSCHARDKRKEEVISNCHLYSCMRQSDNKHIIQRNKSGNDKVRRCVIFSKHEERRILSNHV